MLSSSVSIRWASDEVVAAARHGALRLQFMIDGITSPSTRPLRLDGTNRIKGRCAALRTVRAPPGRPPSRIGSRSHDAGRQPAGRFMSCRHSWAGPQCLCMMVLRRGVLFSVDAPRSLLPPAVKGPDSSRAGRASVGVPFARSTLLHAVDDTGAPVPGLAIYALSREATGPCAGVCPADAHRVDSGRSLYQVGTTYVGEAQVCSWPA